MKNFLRKLHIGDSAGGDGASSPAPVAPPPPPAKKGQHKHASGLSGWLSSVTGRPHAPPPLPPLPTPAAAASAAEVEAEENALATALASSVEERRVAREEESRKEAEDERKREAEMEKKEKREAELEDYHMQLALEMSVREDPEAMQIEVAKQISLGSCPLQSSPAEVVAFRYWERESSSQHRRSFNALSYDDKILDGFYDICATRDEATLSTIPSLMELQALPFSHGAKTEAVLVNKALDSELVALEQKAFIMTVEIRSKNSEFVGRTLVQTLVNLVSNYMGGPVVDPESMLLKYRNMSSALRAAIRSAVIPLGQLKVGLARHRALLFKVLADSIAVPCRLVKGRQYTGSDDGALNIVKFNDGRECIVDLMIDPGTLIPSDGADLGREVEDCLFVDDQHDSNTPLISSFSEASSSIHGSFEHESLEKGFTPSNAGNSGPYGATNAQTDNDVSGSGVSSSFEELSVSTYASENMPIIHESNADHTMTSKSKDKSITSNNSSSSSPPSSEMGSTPAVRRKKVKDVSEYMISAAKENPQLAEKIHAVLLESGVVPPPDLFSEESKEQPKDLIVYDTSVFQTKDEMIRTMNELESTSHDCSGGHGPSLPNHPGHELKIVPYRTPLDLKPVQGLGVYHPFDSRDNAAPSIPLYEPSAPPQENPLQLMKQMPVTAAAVATAAVVASSMVVAAAKSNSDIKLDVPVAAAATAAAVVATTAAVNKQYEYLDPSCQLLCLPSSSTKSIQKGRHDLLDSDHLDTALEHEKDSVQAPQEAERVSDRSTGTESARSEIALDDVAEFEIQWEDLMLGERVGLGSFGEVYRGEWHGTEVAVKKFLQQDISSDALEEFRTEVGIMRRLRHPNVVLFMGAVTRVPHLSIVTEFLPSKMLLYKNTNFELLNSAFITLLPKKEDASNIKDYRPISLVHSFAKLTTKILANRLAATLDKLISPNQSAFIKGRFILDNFLLVHHTTKFLHQQKEARILLKLDINKAFDSVSWPFLLEVLKHLGFGSVWCDILSGLLATSSTQVLLNGSPGERIQHQRGLRQGDPLSPMLFILVMDVLCHLVKKAADEQLLQPLARRALQHRISLYADDVVLFLRPSAGDIEITLDILQLFGSASGLTTNLQKSSVLPIRCSEDDRAVLQETLPCQLSDFPCKYLGVPLSPLKLTKEQVQPIIEKIADRLPSWKADLLTKARRMILVQFVLTSMLIYIIMALDLPPWALKAIDKIRRGFLWKGRRDARGGHCLLAWPKVARPRNLGGLGISNLQNLGYALKLRWLWLQKTEPNKAWAFFPIQAQAQVQAFFNMAVKTVVGNGKNTYFWKDRWLLDQSLEQALPHLFSCITVRARKRSVFDAIIGGRWISDIKGALTVPVLVEYLHLWELLSNVVLQPDVEDTHIWKFLASGSYSTKSAYEALFIGATYFKPWEEIWKSWAPGKCKFFMWTATHNRCWTADRLARRGLDHPPRCPLCDQVGETMDHLLVSCVFSRQLWFSILQLFGLDAAAPQLDDLTFVDWWVKASSRFSGQEKKGFDSIIILGAWLIWKHRNSCLFDGGRPNLAHVISTFKEEAHLWAVAGARGVSHLLALASAS